ncbi:hypothetical protein [Maribacter sp. 2308TA10-17]|uniref:hypothetical protein n=1 Tax=Maribacter sp. 2308TA10-17 TaxID=3386276 RepID=UPI0039BCD052
MENSNLKGRILMEMEDLIAQSCPKQKVAPDYETLHVAILKKHYNAADVSIDYHRRRVEMELVMDDKDYDPKTVNLYMPTLHVNLWFRNLRDFLKSCIDYDNKSLAFYASLLSSYTNKNLPLMTA